ncbi:hypothetical protein CAEBREN_25031 [Caenorhabditis brenneri]|uniref:SPK domain-containing protein n=1 Tax=Caenorhabditis brenneri TaxID=135651 RepID=G0PIU0_CAEBE|nr:hypothetical protein CAEBREN_25031 [Caenorhabditis brenneri]
MTVIRLSKMEQESRPLHFFDFFKNEARNAAITMDLKALCVKYKESMTTKRTVEELYDKFHRNITGNMDNIQRFDCMTKASVLFSFGISPHPELLRK